MWTAVASAALAAVSSIDWGATAGSVMKWIGGASIAAQAMPNGRGGKTVDTLRQLANLVAMNWGTDTKPTDTVAK